MCSALKTKLCKEAILHSQPVFKGVSIVFTFTYTQALFYFLPLISEPLHREIGLDACRSFVSLMDVSLYCLYLTQSLAILVPDIINSV